MRDPTQQGRQDSNLQPPVLETGALPIELRPWARGLYPGVFRAPPAITLAVCRSARSVPFSAALLRLSPPSLLPRSPARARTRGAGWWPPRRSRWPRGSPPWPFLPSGVEEKSWAHRILLTVSRPDETQTLWRQYRKTGEQGLRDRLILTYAPLVKYVAGRLGSGLPAHVDEGDLVCSGLLGLTGAIERYDPDRDVKFETYAIARIKGSIIDELRAMDWVPRSVRARAREIERE